MPPAFVMIMPALLPFVALCRCFSYAFLDNRQAASTPSN